MKRFFCLLAIMFAAVSLSAQTIKVEAPNLVSVGESFKVSFSINGDEAPKDFTWSQGEDFKLVWGPQKGTSTSFSMINGNTTRSTSTSYTYVLEAVKAGEFKLPAATATINGSFIKSRSISIEVVSGGNGSSTQSSSGSSSSGSSGSSQSSSQGSAAVSGDVSSGDIFMRLSFSKTSAVVGEPITANLKLYHNVYFSGGEDVKFPSFIGFWSQQTYAPTSLDFTREKVGDKIYNAATIRSWTLVPQKAGDLEVDPAEMVCLISVRKPRKSSGSIFDNFFQDDYQTLRKRISTRPTRIHVSSLPSGAPSSFGGGVGSFTMNASLSCDSLKTHEAASLLVTVSGNGNVSLLEAPKINFPADFEQYDVKTVDKSKSKTFEFPFIPRSAGEFEIGPVEYSYYDPSAGRYVTLSSGPLHLKVLKGAEVAAESAGGTLVETRKDVKSLGSDIRFISTRTSSLSGSDRYLVFSPLFFGLLGLMLVVALIIWLVSRKLTSMREDVVGSRNRGASKMARKRLALASSYLKKNLYTAFYEELHRALLGFISDKFNMDAAEQNKENIQAKLLECGVPEAVSNDFIGLLDACEFARYAPDAGHEAMNAHYENAVGVISEIDSAMRRRRKTQDGGASGAGIAMLALLLMLVPFNGKAADATADSLWTAGVNAYTEGRWSEAEESWQLLYDEGKRSPELLYNIGNACFRQNDYAGAVLNYERALKLDPSYSDARFNLEFVNSVIRDKIDVVPEFFMVSLMRKFCRLLSSNEWAWLSLLFAAGVLAMVLIFLLGTRSSSRKAGFFGAIVLFLLMALCVWFAAWQKRDASASDEAVVMKSVVSVKSTPGSADNKDLFILHEGTKVKLVDEVGEWIDIQLVDGRRGWLERDNVEII